MLRIIAIFLSAVLVFLAAMAFRAATSERVPLPTARNYLLPLEDYEAVQRQENVAFFDKDLGLNHTKIPTLYPALYDLYQRYGMYSSTNAKYFLSDTDYFDVNIYIMRDEKAARAFIQAQASSLEHGDKSYSHNADILPSLLSHKLQLFYQGQIVAMLRLVDGGEGERQTAFEEFAEMYQHWLLEQPFSDRYE